MITYWRIRTGPLEKGGFYTYIKTDGKYIPDMVVDIAIRQGMFCDVFLTSVDEVKEITKEDYLEKMWE